MTSTAKPLGPVAIGGVGGSGTRVVAQFLKDFGYHIGNDLNHANDNLWFTFLFQRPVWFRKVSEENPSEITRALHIYEQLMTGGRLTFDAYTFLVRSLASDIAGLRRNHTGLHWRLERGFMIAFKRRWPNSQRRGWGWKAPITHIYVPYLAECFPQLKYVHVIRHGLDMAFSSNRAQLFNWGDFMGTPAPSDPTLIAQATLKFWVAANRRAVELGEKLLGPRFLLLNFDELCHRPQEGIRLLVDFLGLEAGEVDIDGMAKLVRTPSSIGRYRKNELSGFALEDIEAVRKLGFVVELPQVG